MAPSNRDHPPIEANPSSVASDTNAHLARCCSPIEDEPMSEGFHPVEGRDIAAMLNPRPLVIVGASNAQGRIGFATIIWATPVSHSPAMVAFALREKSHTMSIIQETGYFSLATLPFDEEGIRIAQLCGNSTGHRADKGAEVAHELERSGSDGRVIPIPRHALSWVACKVSSISETGDHLLVTGEVIRAVSKLDRDDHGRLDPCETMLCVQREAFDRL